MGEECLSRLIDEVNSLIETDKKVVEAVLKENFEALDSLIKNFCALKISVQEKLGSLPAIEGVDDATRELLLRVQKKFPTDAIIASMEDAQEDSSDFFELYGLSDDEVWDLGLGLFYSKISHYEYMRDLFKISTIILKSSVPKELKGYLHEVRECFCLKQYNATISLCRTIIEAAAKDLCEKLGFFAGYGEKVIVINSKVFSQLINVISKGRLKRRAVQIYYRDACPVVHGNRVVNKQEALQVLRETLEIVQSLYSSNGF